MVTVGIFMGMTTVVLALMLQNQRASEKISSRTDATSEVLIVFEKVRQEMRSGRVVGVDPGGRLQYWILRRTNAGPQLTPQGLADWLPGFPADPDVATMFVNTGMLWKSFQGTTSRLAPVGPDGQIVFNWSPGLRTLTLTGDLGQKDPFNATRNSMQKFHLEIYLTNNE
ncbi:hypothetical protein DYH09_22180 [bacterium CPR1]|nr:hypothetical protein [bacterium CPR1]